MVLATTPNHASSGLRRRCSTATSDNDIMALMQCPSLLSVPTLMRHFYAYNAILRASHTMRRVDVMVAATPNLTSSGLIRRCSTATSDNDLMALMQCPSVQEGSNFACRGFIFRNIVAADTVRGAVARDLIRSRPCGPTASLGNIVFDQCMFESNLGEVSLH